MINIEFAEEINAAPENFIDKEFNRYATQNGVSCNYRNFCFIAKENGGVVGVLTGYHYYAEVHVGDLIVLEDHRGKGIGTKLMQEFESYFKDKNFNNISLTTKEFQAPKFYKKLGYKIEFIRENKENPKLTTYFLVKFF
ncbi:MAG: GNAT family N-acetyltransferase [Oscillospiraceae bacterium]|jgi:ribosomal protein S18 acetylase RimI-like enzyme|nr:GNAT family N-acetyltransferase [Oscillospiraceae bacterium]